MSYIKWFERNTRSVLYLLIAIAITLPILNPIGLPIRVSTESIVWYNTVEELPPGSLVHFGVDTGIGGYGSLKSRAIASVRHLFMKNAKIVFVAFQVEGPVIYPTLIEDVRPQDFGKEYGVDYVFLGYIPGKEIAVAAYAQDIRELISVDYFGTPLDELPIMKDVNDITDFDLVQDHSSGGMPFWHIDQIYVPYNKPLQINMIAVSAPELAPYYPDQIIGLLSTPRHGAEYELLINRPGFGISDFDAQTIAHAVLIIFLIGGNISTLMQRGKSERRLS
jgi:hypothetical protein